MERKVSHVKMTFVYSDVRQITSSSCNVGACRITKHKCKCEDSGMKLGLTATYLGRNCKLPCIFSFPIKSPAFQLPQMLN